MRLPFLRAWAACACALATLAVLLARALSRPLERLASAAQAVRDGELETSSGLPPGRNEVLAECVWPFERSGFKPVRTDSWDATGSLVKAGALIAAAIDRLAEVRDGR